MKPSRTFKTKKFLSTAHIARPARILIFAFLLPIFADSCTSAKDERLSFGETVLGLIYYDQLLTGPACPPAVLGTPPAPTQASDVAFENEYDGTIRVDGFFQDECRSQSIPVYTQYVKICLQGQTYDPGLGTCEGLPVSYSYCGTNDFSCDIERRTNEYWTADPTMSPAQAACASDATGGHAWRLLNREEVLLSTALNGRLFGVNGLNPDFPLGAAGRVWFGDTRYYSSALSFYLEDLPDTSYRSIVLEPYAKSQTAFALCVTDPIPVQ